MIPKASQRGLGQDLATHLQNAYDNEYVEIAEVRGAVARDLHGAFAEWEALRPCHDRLPQLPLQPLGQSRSGAGAADPGAVPRLYRPRRREAGACPASRAPIVFHIKEGREHCHVIWSRIDAEQGKAIHQAFDRQKLMMVTRQFARDHGLRLPDGMIPDAGRERGRRRPSRSTRSASRTKPASPRKNGSSR